MAVSWADGRLDDKERKAILKAASERGVTPGSPNYTMLEVWLKEKPGPALMDAWRKYARAIYKELTEEELQSCYVCHTTGYGEPGGFINEETTPDLKNAGCEVCHGPGELHARTGDPRHIKGHLTERDCEGCHTSERVKTFRYKPLTRGGAH